MSATPSSSHSAQRVTAGWTAEENAKMDKYLLKQAAGHEISNEKWESAFRRHSFASTSAKKRHRLVELQKMGKISSSATLPSTSKSSKKKDKTATQVNRDLFNAVFSGLGSAPSSSSSSSMNDGNSGKIFSCFCFIF